MGQNNKKMKETNIFFEAIFNRIRVYCIIITNKNFLIQRFNKGAELLFEYSIEETENKLHIQNLIPEHSLKKFDEINDALKILNLIRREVEMKTKNNELVYVDLTVTKIMDNKGRHTGYIFFASDITEHKKLKDSIEKQNLELAMLYEDTQKANKAKSIFLANMSHELRTPLTAILGFSELLMDEKVGTLTLKQKDLQNDVHKSAQHLLNLINNILDLSKIEAEKLKVTIEKVCLNDIIDSAVTFILPVVRKKDIKLINEISKKKIWIKADESRLKQILYNLYSNAVKFTPDKGTIITKVQIKKSIVFVSVIDNGIGIKPEHQKIIFEEFYQIETPYTKKYAGTGLGLTLVKKFIEMMGGEIFVISKGEDKGSTFTFTVPLNE